MPASVFTFIWRNPSHHITPGVRIVVASPEWSGPYRGRAKRDCVGQYSAERKEALLRQMMPPQNRLVSELARESGITEQTLYTWRGSGANYG